MPGGAEAGAVRFVGTGGTNTLTFCFLPFSSTAKSSAFKPVTGCPFLSVTTTSTTTSLVLERSVTDGTSLNDCWASRPKGVAASLKIRSDPEIMRKDKAGTGGLHSRQCCERPESTLFPDYWQCILLLSSDI